MDDRDPEETGHPWAIAGIDPSGGAGLYQDLRVMESMGLKPMGVPTALTVQNRAVVKGVDPVDERLFLSMLETLHEEDSPTVIKIGLLPDSLVGSLRGFLEDLPKRTPAVLDPVFRFGTGRHFWRPSTFREMARTLFPLMTLVTPNLPEAQELSGWSVERFPEDLSLMARRIHEQFGVWSVLIKGGHHEGPGPKVDLLWSPEGERFFTHPSRDIPSVHGGGCTLSSLIAGLMSTYPDRSLDLLVEEALRLYQCLLGTARGRTRLVLDPRDLHSARGR